MDSILIARIGIILSALGGFLVAPELIGINRIDAFQKWLLNIAGIVRPSLNNAYYWAHDDASAGLVRFTSLDFEIEEEIRKSKLPLLPKLARLAFFFTVIPAILIIIVLRWIGWLNIEWVVPYWVVILIFGFIGPVVVYWTNGSLGNQHKSRNCLYLVSLYPLSILYLTGLPAWYLLALFIFIISIPVEIFEFVLRGKNKLKNILQKTGIIILVLGAILQLITVK